MSSSSEFLTFYRRFASQPLIRSRFSASTSSYARSTRPFSISSVSRAGGGLGQKDETHATDKKDKLDVQSEQSGKGRDAKANNEGGSATSQSDSQNSTQKAKDDHPEAPDVVIGMQDERGGKGH